MEEVIIATRVIKYESKKMKLNRLGLTQNNLI